MFIRERAESAELRAQGEEKKRLRAQSAGRSEKAKGSVQRPIYKTRLLLFLTGDIVHHYL
jgi:hypothetical protein